ncbi:MAG: germination protein YpeB [Clostridia bacterium]
MENNNEIKKDHKIDEIKAAQRKNTAKTVAIIVLAVLLSFAIGVSVALGIVARNYMIETESYYKKAYNQLVMDVNDLDSELSKLFVMNSDEARAITLSEVSSIAVSAESSLENLPISKDGVSQLTKYFNQLMDYSKFLTKKVVKEEDISDEDLQTLQKLFAVNTKLKESINEGFEKASNDNGLYSKGLLMNLNYIDPLDITYGVVSEGSFEYPTMIYDGPFSDKKKEAEEKPVEVKFSKEQATEIARKFDEKVANLELNGEEKDSLVYSFSGEKNGQNVYIQVSKESGKVVLFDMYRVVDEKKVKY